MANLGGWEGRVRRIRLEKGEGVVMRWGEEEENE